MDYGAEPKFYVVKVDIPDNFVKKVFRPLGNHDGIEPV